jgi:hypothetical protein
MLQMQDLREIGRQSLIRGYRCVNLEHVSIPFSETLAARLLSSTFDRPSPQLLICVEGEDEEATLSYHWWAERITA